METLEIERDYIRDNGECPDDIKENTFAYTIVDLKEKMRGADNYYCKFNYLDKEECIEAIVELNTIENSWEVNETMYYEYKMEISKRNRVELSRYIIK